MATRRQNLFIPPLDAGGIRAEVQMFLLGSKGERNVAEQSLQVELCFLKDSPSHAALHHIYIINAFKSTLAGCCPLPVRHSKERLASEKLPKGTYRDQRAFQTSSLKGGLFWGSLGLD